MSIIVIKTCHNSPKRQILHTQNGRLYHNRKTRYPRASNTPSSRRKISDECQTKCKYPEENLSTTRSIPLSSYQVFISSHVNPKDYARRFKGYAHKPNFPSTRRQ